MSTKVTKNPCMVFPQGKLILARAALFSFSCGTYEVRPTYAWCFCSFLWPTPWSPDKRQGKLSPPLLRDSVSVQASWQGDSLSRVHPSSSTDKWTSLDNLEKPHCLNNKNDGVLVRHNIIIVFFPGNFWIPNSYLESIILFCQVPKECVHISKM